MAPFLEATNASTNIEIARGNGTEAMGIKSFKINLSEEGEIDKQRLIEQFMRVNARFGAGFITYEDRGTLRMIVFEGRIDFKHSHVFESLGEVTLKDAGFINRYMDELIIDEEVFADSLIGDGGFPLSRYEARVNRSKFSEDQYEKSYLLVRNIGDLI